MKYCLAAVFVGTPRRIELREIALPGLGRGEALVRVLGCTICGSDLHTFEGRRTVPVPTILGHEMVGELVALDADAPTHDLAGERLSTGDRITWSIVAGCGTCYLCQRGLPQKCLAAVKYGHQDLQPGRELLGGLAQYCLLVPGTALLRLPVELPLEVACPANCATATVAAVLEAAGAIRNRTVGVLGCGLLGLTACAMAKVQGASAVFAVDVDTSRRTRALSFGAIDAVAPDELPTHVRRLTQGHGLDVVLELSGAPAAFENAWPLVRLGGTLVIAGSVFPSRPVPLALEEIVRRNLHLHGVHNYSAQHLVSAVRFLGEQHKQFPFTELVASWRSLREAESAFALAADARHVRVGVRP